MDRVPGIPTFWGAGERGPHQEDRRSSEKRMNQDRMVSWSPVKPSPKEGDGVGGDGNVGSGVNGLYWTVLGRGLREKGAS